MRDLLTEILNSLSSDPVISKYVKRSDIRFYDYPNAKDIKNNLIIIDELLTPSFKGFADNQPLSYEFAFQIDVFIKQNSNNENASLISREVISRVTKIMWQQGFVELNTMKPEYIKDFNFYRQSKQFRGRKYINEMEQF